LKEKFDIDIIVPNVRKNRSYFDEKKKETVHFAYEFNELPSSIELLVPGFEYYKFKIKVYKRIGVVLDSLPAFYWHDVKHAKIMLKFSTQAELYDDAEIDLSIQSFVHSLEQTILVYLTSLEVSAPGLIATIESVILANNKLVGSIQPFKSIIGEILEFNSGIRWPKIEKLEFSTTLKWVEENFLSIIGVSTNPLQRAFNSITHLIGHSNKNHVSDIELFWIMMGIEALYANGEIGIAEQIRIKTQIILGEMKEFKKEIKKMYNYRSRFTHGDINIPSSFHRNDSIELEQYSVENYHSTLLACSILLSTIQFMIKNDYDKLNFNYKLENE